MRLSLHTRIVLTSSAALVIGGAVALYALESGNARTLGPLSFTEQLLAALFQSVTMRTAGFNTLDIGAMTQTSLFLAMALMFIGGSPGGTGGGVKTTTFSITVAALWATVRGDADTIMFKRLVPPDTVAKAFFVCLIAFLARRRRARDAKTRLDADTLRDDVGVRHRGRVNGRSGPTGQSCRPVQPGRQGTDHGDDVRRACWSVDAGRRAGAPRGDPAEDAISRGEGADWLDAVLR